MNKSPDLSQLSIDQLRTLVEQQVQALAHKEEIIAQRNETITQHRAEIVQRDEAIKRYRIREEQMSHEIALLRRHSYGQRSEGLDKHQLSLLQELIDEDTSAVEMER